MADTRIEWADKVWNPVTGCTRASAGCDNCYAVQMSKRLASMGQRKYQGLVNPGKSHFNGVVRTWRDELNKPLRWKKPTRIFVNSMSDLFHENVPSIFIDEVFSVMGLCRQHTFMVLTKRADRMEEYILAEHPLYGNRVPRPLPNVLLGISVESQEMADKRHGHLARLHDQGWRTFWSAEPLLGAVSIAEACYGGGRLPESEGFGLDWVICGGESGKDARPMHPDWARRLRDECQAARVPFLFKQWGEWLPSDHFQRDPEYIRWSNNEGIGLCITEAPGFTHIRSEMFRVGKKAAGRLLDSRVWNEFPEVRG